MSIEFGKQRSDCSSQYLDLLMEQLRSVSDVPGDIVEIGSYLCGAAICMAVTAPEKKVYAFDLFGGLPYGPQAGFENFGKNNFEEVKYATSRFANLELVRGLHEETVPNFFSRSISFVHMDSDHYSSHKVSLQSIWPFLAPGGIIMFHDWDYSFPGVQQAVKEVFTTDKIEQCDIFTPQLIRKSKFSQTLG